MKKKSPPYAIIGAVILGLAAAYFYIQHEQQLERDKQAAIAAAKAEGDRALADAKAHQVTVSETPTNVRKVLYATQPVDAGQRMSSAFYETKLTPRDIMPDAYTADNDIVGWYAIRKIEKGDPLTPRNIGKSLPYMSQRISPGMRALSLNVFNAAYNDTGGFIVDGDKVDLLYTVDNLDGSIKLNTQMVMQNLSVLYVPGPTIKTEKTDGITPIPPPGDPIAVTFEVTPEQAEALIYMSRVKNGQFSMILRARKDDSEIHIKPFAGADYDFTHLTKIQRTVDKSIDRVKELAAEIDAKEKAEGTTNETNPTPPSP